MNTFSWMRTTMRRTTQKLRPPSWLKPPSNISWRISNMESNLLLTGLYNLAYSWSETPANVLPRHSFTPKSRNSWTLKPKWKIRFNLKTNLPLGFRKLQNNRHTVEKLVYRIQASNMETAQQHQFCEFHQDTLSALANILNSIAFGHKSVKCLTVMISKFITQLLMPTPN